MWAASCAVMASGRRVLVLPFASAGPRRRKDGLQFLVAGGEDGLVIEVFSFGTTTGMTILTGPSGLSALAEMADALGEKVPPPSDGMARVTVALRATKGRVLAADRELFEGIVSWDLGAPSLPRSLPVRIEPEARRIMFQELEPGALLDLVRLAAGAMPETARQRAFRLYDAKDLAGARLAVEEALAANPRDGTARLLLAQVQEKLGELEAALQAYSEVVASGTGRAQARSGRARVQEKLGRTEEALADLDALIAAGDNTREPRLWRARLLLGQGRAAEALVDLDAGLAVPGFSADIAHKLRSEALAALGRNEEAAQALALSKQNESSFSAMFDSFGAKGPPR